MTQKPPKHRRTWFISWRWRIVLPLFLTVTAVAMVAAYVVASGFGRSFGVSQDNILLESVRGMGGRATSLYRRQLQEAQRIAFTIGVPEAVQQEGTDILADSLEATARAADLDSVIITNVSGVEVLGLQRVLVPDVDDYAVNTGTDLAAQQIVRDALGGRTGEAALFRTPEGTLLYVSAPLLIGEDVVGAVLVGQHMESVATELAGTAVASVAVYSADGILAETTFDLNDQISTDLRLPTAIFDDTLTGDPTTVPVRSVRIGDVPHRAAYVPLSYGENTLGVVGVLLPDSLPFATEMGRQLVGLMAAVITGASVTVVFLLVAVFTGRVERVGQTARALARGEVAARTDMRPTDEAGVTGAALDAYADRVQREQDALQSVLRRQRRETNHLVAVLQSMPEGVIVQDNEGHVTLINEEAQRLFNGQESLAHHDALRAMTEQVSATFGDAIAPGVYTLGDPQQISVGGRMLNAQAAAILTVSKERVGTVVVLRDISEFVEKELERERLLRRVEKEVELPLAELAQTGAFGAPPMDAFAKAVSRRAVALQKLVVEMRELTAPDAARLEQEQKIIRLDTLVWSVANEWRQIAQAADLSLEVSIDAAGLHILGDEKRLRWAIGNILDNAIKYTPPGGAVTLEINGESSGQATLRVRDNGVGIVSEELPRVTARFYRGNPTMDSGEIIRTPGMGQGLYTARNIFEAHGGYLQLRSKPGTGTAVYFSMPITAATAMDVPIIKETFEGETVKLPADYLSGLDL